MLFKSLFLCFSESQPLYVVRIIPMVHNICPTVVKRLPSVQVAGADAGEITTDTAEGHLDEKSLIFVGYDRASNQRRVSMGCPPGADTRIKGQTGQKQFEF